MKLEGRMPGRIRKLIVGSISWVPDFAIHFFFQLSLILTQGPPRTETVIMSETITKH
jgi:hypothetical protein